jgi:asparagine synthase (glutamine-hydrolysing)
MCGIAGTLKCKGGAVDPAALHRMVDMLSHRGPDGRGVYTGGKVGLGHARLSIIDVADGGQPMSNKEGTIWISFNGEIFNYVELRASLEKRGSTFVTKSDTEVIIRLYEEKGEECVHDMNGQWAFAIWDAPKNKLFLSRDRMGIKPLFYAHTADGLLFASEIKALFAFGPGLDRRLDYRALDQIFTFWVTLPPRTAFEGVHQLPPGHSMIVQAGRTEVIQYWRPTYEPVDPDDSPEFVNAKTEELLDLVQDATRIRLRSDVPVGAYLSGGIDSTLITALIQRSRNGGLRTFSVAFDDDEFDESAYQHKASVFLNTDHQQVRCSYGNIGEIFPRVIWHAEQPILRTAPGPLFWLSRLVHDSGLKVILTGEGADEVLGGYDIFKEAKIRRFWGVDLHSCRRPLLLRRLYPYMQNMHAGSDAYLKSFFHVTESDLRSPFFSHLPRWQLTAQLKVFFSQDVRSQLGSYDSFAEIAAALPVHYLKWPHFCQAEYLETALLLPGYILSSQGDRMAMANSVEARYPFLDHRVVEFAAKLPPALKMKVLNQKYLLKRASKGLVPPDILNRPKQPYRAPDGKSFFHPQPLEYVSDLVSPDKIRQNGVFDATAVAALVNKFKIGRAIGVKDNMALAGILSTQLIAERFVEHIQ